MLSNEADILIEIIALHFFLFSLQVSPEDADETYHMRFIEWLHSHIITALKKDRLWSNTFDKEQFVNIWNNRIEEYLDVFRAHWDWVEWDERRASTKAKSGLGCPFYQLLQSQAG